MMLVRRRFRFCISAFLLVLGSLTLSEVLRGADPPATLAVTGRSNANVSLAASGAFVVGVWSASVPSGVTDIFSAVSRDRGDTFSPPIRVNSTVGQASVNGEQPPRVTLVGRPGTTPAIVVVWTAKSANGTSLLTARSDDGGRTFGRSLPVPGSEAAGNRGWEGISADSRGRVGVVWLDHRALAKQGESMASMHHATSHDAAAPSSPKLDGVAMAQQSKLYFAAIGDSGSVREISGGVCYCCKTAIAPGPANSIFLAWRHVYPGNLRDIAFTVSRDGGKTFASPIRVSEDKWQLEGCPDDGPAMVVDGQGATHIVWPTNIGLFYATSRDGKRFEPRVRIATQGLAHHPQLALASNGSLALTWDELAGGMRRIAFARKGATTDGRVTFSREILSAAEPSIYPMVVSAGDRFLTGWTSGSPATSVIRIDRR
jgi:hypothetical protein